MLRRGLFTAALVAGFSAPAAAEEINLVCLGAGSANKFTTTQGYVWNNSGDSAWGNVIGNRSQPFDDQVNISLDDEESRIRMPRALLPAIRGGKDGWFKIKSLKFGENEITGSVAVSLVNNPKLRIDRLTGAISISGKTGDYSGTCAKYDPENVQRAF